jgi:hypothetical protein
MELKEKKKLFLISMAIPILAVVHVAGISTISFLQTQIAVAQQTTGDITRSSDGKPFGGEKMGTVSIDSTGRRTNVTADLTASPNEGKVFEGWLVDADGSGYKLSLGQFRNGTLNFSEYMVNPYTYKNFEITEEPSEDTDPNAAASIAGFELKTPFGR